MKWFIKLKKENPDLEIIINGGISKIKEIKNHLKICNGVMIGRAIYQNPYFLVDIEKEIFNVKKSSYKRRGDREIIKIFRKRS